METGGILILLGLLLLFTIGKDAPTGAGIIAPFVLLPGIVTFLLGFFKVIPNSVKENMVLLVIGILVLFSIRFWLKFIIKRLKGEDVFE